MATKKAAKKSSKKSAKKSASKRGGVKKSSIATPPLMPPIFRPPTSHSFICVKGTLTDEGVECQALRGDDGKLYTLLGNLKGYGIGDKVMVCGNVAQISFCMQGTTIAVTWIGRKAYKVS